MIIFNKARKEFIDLFAEDIVKQFDFKEVIIPERIAEFNELPYFFDHYGSYFDGMLVWDKSQFYAHINLDRVITNNSPRSRFTFAHELGHFFIEEHQIAIKGASHPSKYRIDDKNLMEQEANYFAASLLMPYNQFKRACYKRKLSFVLIEELSHLFQTSSLATILRFIVAGTYPVMVSFFENKRLKWFDRSEDFPYKVFKSKISQPPPPTSVLGEYYLDPEKKFTTIERINTDDWFVTNFKTTLNEQCFYSDYGYEISMVWPD
jgi:Zn-dependent peptidase ImmA (M78 family)